MRHYIRFQYIFNSQHEFLFSFPIPFKRVREKTGNKQQKFVPFTAISKSAFEECVLTLCIVFVFWWYKLYYVRCTGLPCLWCRKSIYNCLEDKSKENVYCVVAPFDVGNFIVNQIIKGEKRRKKPNYDLIERECRGAKQA